MTFYNPRVLGLHHSSVIPAGRASLRRIRGVGENLDKPYFCLLPFTHMWMKTGRVNFSFFFFDLPHINHMVSHSRCVSLPPPLLGNHEFISCVSAPFPPRFRSPSAIWSPSAFLFVCFIVCVVFFFFFFCHTPGWRLWLQRRLPRKRERLMDAAGVVRCCRERNLWGTCWVAEQGGTREWGRMGRRRQGPWRLLNLANREWGEGEGNCIYQCRARVF